MGHRRRISEVLALRPIDVHRDSVVLPSRKNPARPTRIMHAASERAGVQVLAFRASQHGEHGEPAPVHPHLFRYARVRQIVRSTRNLPLAQRQAGWSRLQMAYLTIGDEEARDLMRGLTD